MRGKWQKRLLSLEFACLYCRTMTQVARRKHKLDEVAAECRERGAREVRHHEMTGVSKKFFFE